MCKVGFSHTSSSKVFLLEKQDMKNLILLTVSKTYIQSREFKIIFILFSKDKTQILNLLFLIAHVQLSASTSLFPSALKSLPYQNQEEGAQDFINFTTGQTYLLMAQCQEAMEEASLTTGQWSLLKSLFFRFFFLAHIPTLILEPRQGLGRLSQTVIQLILKKKKVDFVIISQVAIDVVKIQSKTKSKAIIVTPASMWLSVKRFVFHSYSVTIPVHSPGKLSAEPTSCASTMLKSFQPHTKGREIYVGSSGTIQDQPWKQHLPLVPSFLDQNLSHIPPNSTQGRA